MNIWALDKDPGIKHVLLLLTDCLSTQGFRICDEPGLDPMAIRIYKPDEIEMSAYLYTYGQDEERYGVHLEYPEHAGTPAGKTIEMQEGLDFEQLLAVLQVHLL